MNKLLYSLWNALLREHKNIEKKTTSNSSIFTIGENKTPIISKELINKERDKPDKGTKPYTYCSIFL